MLIPMDKKRLNKKNGWEICSFGFDGDDDDDGEETFLDLLFFFILVVLFSQCGEVTRFLVELRGF